MSTSLSSTQSQWSLSDYGIDRQVITTDIHCYLGPDTLIEPGTGTGEHEGQSGYWITSHSKLTLDMIQDLKLDSQRWRDGRGGWRQSEHGEGPRDFGEETHGPREDYSTSTRTNTHGSDEVPTYSYTMARPDGSDSYTSSPPTGGYYTTVSGYPLEPAPGYYIASDGCQYSLSLKQERPQTICRRRDGSWSETEIGTGMEREEEYPKSCL